MAATLDTRVRDYIQHLRNKVANHPMAKKAEQKAGEAKMCVEVLGAGVGSQYLIGRIEQQTGKKLEAFGVPVDLAAGAAFVALGLFDLAGKYDEDALYMGVGVITAHMGRKSYAFGQSAASEHRFLGMSSIAGVIDSDRRVPFNADAELAAELRRSA